MIDRSRVAIAYLSLGSNLGDRLENLREAMRRLGDAGIALKRTSSVYETEPVDNAAQGWFLNCVAEVSTTLEPLEFLHRLQVVERELGRERTVPKGPRTIDIDILLYDDLLIETDELTVPHPRMLQRRFVLEPLCEIAPTLAIPGSAKIVEQALHELVDPAQVRLLIKSLCA